MGHFINNNSDFVAVVNAERQEPWHRLGQRVDTAMTAEQAIKLANLDFTVSSQPLFAIHPADDEDALLVPNQYAQVATFGDGHLEVFGTVGSRYENLQIVEQFAFMDDIVGKIGGAHYDTAGRLAPPRRDGSVCAQVFLTIDLADAGEIVLDPKGAADKLSSKLVSCGSFDGSLAQRVFRTTTRAVCWNTLIWGMQGASHTFVMKHTKNIRERMAEAREALDVVLKDHERLVAIAEKLVHEAYTDAQFAKLLKQVFPRPKDDNKLPAMRRWNEKFDTAQWLFKEAPTNENIRGTKWAAFNAVGEYVDWYRPVRGADRGLALAAGSISGSPLAVKNRTLALLSN